MIPRTVYRADHELFRATVKRFIAEEVMPHHAEWEKAGQTPREIVRLEPALRAELETAIDRPWERIGPVERSVLLLGVYELLHSPHIPWRVVVNEGIELCKMFGADEAHRYVNGVLDKLARRIRKIEVEGMTGR